MVSRIWLWITNIVVAALTMAGVLLYALLRLPYAVYYGTLGSSPEDVGLGYAETLARSTAGITVAALAVGMLGAIAASAFTVALLYARIVLSSVLVPGVSKKKLADMTDEEYAADSVKRARLLSMVARGDSDRIEALLRLPERTPEQQRRVEQFQQGGAMRMVARLVGDEALRVARWFGARAALLALVGVVLGLPVVAYVDARGVRECSRPWLGRLGMFAITAAPVTLHRVADNGSTTQLLTSRSLMHLGGANDRVVVYDCLRDGVVSLPAGDVLVDAG